MDVLNIARMCHEANRLYCEINAATMDALMPWAMSPKWQQESCIAGVEAVIKNPYMRPHETHTLWCEHKVRDGWTYGKTKDAQAKTHPCLVPYYELPELQRAKDVLFINIVRALMPVQTTTEQVLAWGRGGNADGASALVEVIGAGQYTHKFTDASYVRLNTQQPAMSVLGSGDTPTHESVLAQNMSNAAILAKGDPAALSNYEAAQAHAGEAFDPSAPLIVACAPPVELGVIAERGTLYGTAGDNGVADTKEASDGKEHAEVVEQDQPAQAHGNGQAEGSKGQGRQVGKKARR